MRVALWFERLETMGGPDGRAWGLAATFSSAFLTLPLRQRDVKSRGRGALLKACCTDEASEGIAVCMET